MAAVTVAPLRRADAPAWLAMVRELAEFERLAPPSPSARVRLVRDALGPSHRIRVLIARSPEPAGYAILAWTYSSFLAKPTLWIEDIYVRPQERGRGTAQALLGAIARLARRAGAGRIEGVVLDWNLRAHRFYEKTGARVLPDWRLLRYDEKAIRRIAGASAPRPRRR